MKSKWPSPKKCIDSSNNTEESGEATKEGEEVADTGAGDEEVHLPYDTEECASFFSPSPRIIIYSSNKEFLVWHLTHATMIVLTTEKGMHYSTLKRKSRHKCL